MRLRTLLLALLAVPCLGILVDEPSGGGSGTTLYSVQADAAGESMFYDCGSGGCLPIDTAGTSTWTIEFRLKCPADATGDRPAVSTDDGDSPSTSTLIVTYSETGVEDNLGAWANSVGTDIASGTDIDDNTWKHIAYTFDNGTLEAFVDGSSVGTASQSGVEPAQDRLDIGARPGGGNAPNCDLTDVRIWADVRTSTEISDHYNCRITSAEDGDAYANWQFLEGPGSGTTVADSWGTRDGTLTDSAIWGSSTTLEDCP